MAVSESNVEAAISALTAFSIQTSTEAGSSTNTTANILHATSSRTQGCFDVFYAIATDKLTSDLARSGKTATDAQKEKALAYLIADLQEKKSPDWSARSTSFDGYSVSKAESKTGYMMAYEALIQDSLTTTSISSVLPDPDEDEVVKTLDSSQYPDEWRLTNLHGPNRKTTTPTDSEFIDPI